VRDTNLLEQNNLKIMAIYFPQFHQIPENDAFWGEGFTEWTLLKKCSDDVQQIKKPHHDLGYYDLLDGSTLKTQETIAKKHGLDGFMYYHYWFDDKPVMYKALEKMLDTNTPDMPFFLSWANESWTRRWDGAEKDVLLEQKYYGGDPEKMTSHYRYLSRFFRSANYVKLHNKPLFIIYRISVWNDLAVKDGWDGIEICPTLNGFADNNTYVHVSKWNSVFEFSPMYVHSNPLHREKNNKHVYSYDYDKTWRHIIDSTEGEQPYAKTRFLSGYTGWCNAPRRDGMTREKHVTQFGKSTPHKFEKYLKEHLAQYVVSNNHTKIYIINAWNEWNEQAMLEPNHIDAYGYLEALQNAVKWFD
jgi:hypothetical protein